MAHRAIGTTSGNETRRATKEWDPWLVLETDPQKATNSRTCVFCGWNNVFVRKRALMHFGYGGHPSSDCCKRAPRLVLEKFRNCEGIVPKEMLYEEMYGVTEEGDGIGESIAERPVAVSIEGSVDIPGTNEMLPPNPDSVDSTPAEIGRRRNTPSISCQVSMDEALQVDVR